jgi:uncharacterized protein involved in exopolysaccharide biosynthesis
MTPEIRPPSLSLRNVTLAVFRHRRKLQVLSLSILGCVLLATAVMSRTYRSKGTLLVRLGRENLVLDATATLGQGSVVAVQQSRDTEMNSIAEMLKCQGLLEQVVDAIGPSVILGDAEYVAPGGRAATARSTSWYALPVTGLRYCWRCVSGTAGLGDRDRAILALGKRLEVEAVKKSNVVDVTCQHRSPLLAQAIVAKLIECYLEEHARVNRVHGSHDFFGVQASQLHTELYNLEAELRDLKNRTGLISRDDQEEILVRRIGRVEDELLDATTEMSVAEGRSRQLRQTLAALPKNEVTTRTTGFPDQGTDLMRQQFFNLQMLEQSARVKFTDENPHLQDIVRQAQESRRILDREERERTQVTTALPKVYDDIRSALVQQEPVIASMRTKAETLNVNLAALRRELQTLNENELQIARLEREVELKDADYRKYAVNLEQARIDHALELQRMSNISVAQPATYEPQPVRPLLLVNLALGLVLALFASLGLALLLESLDHSLRTPEDVQWRLELPTLVSIPRFQRTMNGIANGRN